MRIFRPPTRKRRSLFRFEAIHTLRYLCIHRAGVLVRPDGYSTLDRWCGTARGRSLGQQAKARVEINFTQALSKSKGVVATLLLRVRRQVIARILEIFLRTLEPVRRGRWFPRHVSHG